MDYNTFSQQLHTGSVHEIYFFFGEEKLLLERALKSLEKALLPAGLEDFNKDVLAGDATTPKQIAELAMNLPFLSEKRLLIIQPPLNFLSIPKSDKSGQKNLDDLLDYLEHPNPQCCLVFCSETALGKTGRLQKKLQEKAVQVEFAPLKGKNLERWIQQYVEVQGYEMERQALEYLSAINSFDLQIMEQELEKLLAYCAEEKKITWAHVQQIVTKTVEANIFSLSDSIGNKNGTEALQVLKDMFYLGEPVFKLLSFLVRHFRNLILIKDYRSQGYQEGQIKEKTGLHPFVIKKSIRQAERFSMEQLVLGLEQLLQIEVELKSTSANGEALLEQFVIELCYL